MKTVLGIDLGTQSLKVLFYDYESRKVAAAAAAPLSVSRDGTGKAEQEANLWLSALRNALREVPSEVRNSARAAAVSGQQHGFVPVDKMGNVLTPVKLWCDTSTQIEVDEITARCGGRDKCIEYSGNPVLVGYTASKIRWLSKTWPDLYRNMACILLPHDYLNYVMTGTLCMEYGDASGTGLLDVRNRRWSGEMLRAVDSSRDLAECLPPLTRADIIIGKTTTDFAREFGIPAGIPVAPGGGDNMMAAIGTGNVAAGKLTMSLGTSGTLFAYSDVPIIDPRGNIAAFCSSTDGWLPLLCTMNCTYATELMRIPLDVTMPQFDSVIDTVAAGSDGLLSLPFFVGERTPDLPRASASLLGMNARNCSKGHWLRATVEGATYGMRFGLDELRRLGIEGSEIVLTGGGSRSKVWCQIVADICQLPVALLDQDEGASFGAALQALWVLQHEQNQSAGIREIVNEHISRRPEPDYVPGTQSLSVYEQRYAEYRQAITQLTPLFNRNHGNGARQ